MNPKKENPKITKVEELTAIYESSKLKQKGIDRVTFDFDQEFKNGLTPQEAKAESIRRIREWLGK
jgi:hypothetical protein